MRVIYIILILSLLAGCGQPKPIAEKPAEKVIATVNGEPIYLKEFKLSLAIRIKEDPSFKITPDTLNEQIDILINERLILQGKERGRSDIKIYTKLIDY